MNLTELFEKWGDVTDKGRKHGYGPVYDLLLAGREIQHVLEIGVHQGGSLAVWAERYPEAWINGVDRNLDPVQPRLLSKMVMLHRLDVKDSEKLARIAYQYGPFDLIVDDGSHELYDVLIANSVLRYFLTDKGLYVVEDVHEGNGLELYQKLGCRIIDRRDDTRPDSVIVVMP